MSGLSTSIPVYDPATAEQIAEVPDGGKIAVDLAVARARETFRSAVWRARRRCALGLDAHGMSPPRVGLANAQGA